MATYAEYLKSQGATDDEIKILVTPTTERAFAKMQEQAEASTKAALAEYEGKVSKWYADEIKPLTERQQKELVSAKAKAAAREAEIKSLQEAGLLEVAVAQDTRTAAATTAANGTTPEEFDPKKYKLITEDALPQFAAAQGKGMIRLAKILDEHRKLGLPEFDPEQLYDEAAAKGKQFPDYWAEKFNVSAKRQELAEKAQKDHDARIAADAIAKYKAENGAMPGTGAPRPSGFAFSRKSSDNAKLQPWLVGDKEKEDRAVENALKKVAERTGTA